ncbi:hypothetical protein FJY69_01705 [candidate division WOR-3 bacterium]|nr:hypothetical protein [candidate division WOR-3 bacterium]
MLQLLRSAFSNLPLKITALLAALAVWAFAVLDRSYTRTLTVPVVVAQAEAKRTLLDIDTTEAQVIIQAKGKDLLGVHFRQLEFRVPLTETRSGVRQVRLSADDLKLPANVVVRSIKPEFVELRQNEAAGKLVPIRVPTAGQAASGLAVTINPPAVQARLFGSTEELKLVNAVATETLMLATVDRPGVRRLAVVLPEGRFTGVEPESADVTIELEKEGVRIFLDVPVKAVAPGGRSVELDPEEAQIAVAGPASKIDRLTSSDVVAQVKASGLPPGEYRLAAEITLPPDFHMVKCEPQFFDVLVK